MVIKGLLATWAHHVNYSYYTTKSNDAQRALYDIRDGETYTVIKAPDGNCWMTQNLRLGSSTSTITLTSSDSNVTADFMLPTAQTSGDDSWGDASNSRNDKHVYATGNYDYGNYYNWYTATAGTGVGTMSSASDTNLTNATSSICPKGWRLPDGGQDTNASWYSLDLALGGSGTNRNDATQRDKYLGTPYSFVYSGYYPRSGGVDVQGSGGAWWSRSAATSTGRAYNFMINNSGNVFQQNFGNDGDGVSVRCVAK